MVDPLTALSQIGEAIGFFSNIFGVINGITTSLAGMVGITSSGQMYAIFALVFLIAAFFLFKFMEIAVKFLIFVILIWVLASIFGFVG